MNNEQELIKAHLAKKGAFVARPAFARGCEISTPERRLIRRDRRG